MHTPQLTPPIPIDLLAEKVLKLDFLWEEIDELPGETVLGALHPQKRLIIMNEKRRALLTFRTPYTASPAHFF
jgi:hypothetical protein